MAVVKNRAERRGVDPSIRDVSSSLTAKDRIARRQRRWTTPTACIQPIPNARALAKVVKLFVFVSAWGPAGAASFNGVASAGDLHDHQVGVRHHSRLTTSARGRAHVDSGIGWASMMPPRRAPVYCRQSAVHGYLRQDAATGNAAAADGHVRHRHPDQAAIRWRTDARCSLLITDEFAVASSGSSCERTDADLLCRLPGGVAAARTEDDRLQQAPHAGTSSTYFIDRRDEHRWRENAPAASRLLGGRLHMEFAETGIATLRSTTRRRSAEQRGVPHGMAFACSSVEIARSPSTATARPEIGAGEAPARCVRVTEGPPRISC